jgi:hypothetical protein
MAKKGSKRVKNEYLKIDPSKLQIEKTPDGLREYAERKGAKFGIGVANFIWNLFYQNEILPRFKKMTDNEIRRQIITEFRTYKDTTRYYTKEEAVIEARRRYNRGQIGPDSKKRYPPEHLAFRYDIAGNKIYRMQVMTDNDVLHYRAHWTAVHYDRILICPRLWMLPMDHPLVVDHRTRHLTISATVKESLRAKKRRESEKEF